MVRSTLPCVAFSAAQWDNDPPRVVRADLGRLWRRLRMVGFSRIRVGLRVIILLQVKVLASSRQNVHIGRAKLADSSRNSEITVMESE